MVVLPVSFHSYCCNTSKVNIHPGFFGTVPILMTFPGKNISSPGTPICLIFCLVSLILPDLPTSAAVCLRIDGQKLAQILSVYTKKSLVAGALPQTPLGELTMLPQTSKLDPRWLVPVALAPCDSSQSLSRIVMPKLWSP